MLPNLFGGAGFTCTSGMVRQGFHIFFRWNRGKGQSGCYIYKLLLSAVLIFEQAHDTCGMELQSDSMNGLLAEKNDLAFENVFKTHFKRLHAYACTILRDETEAEEIVQQVFYKLWERSESLSMVSI